MRPTADIRELALHYTNFMDLSGIGYNKERLTALIERLEHEINVNCIFSRSFFAKLCEYIDRCNYKSDAEFYRAVGISRQSFSRIKKTKDAGVLPSKQNIIRMAVELELNEDEALELLNLAGYTFQNNKKRDVIINFCFKKGIYDRFIIDYVLFYFRESPLFSEP